MAKARNVIQLSFKSDGDEYQLYLFLRQKLNAAAFIKETLWDLYNNRDTTLTKQLVSEPAHIYELDEIYHTNSAARVEEVKEEPIISLFNEDAERDEVEF